MFKVNYKILKKVNDNGTLREKCLNTEFFSGPYFIVISPNTEKYGPEKTPYLDTFHTLGITRSFF